MFFIPNLPLGFGLYFCFILSGFLLDFSQLHDIFVAQFTSYFHVFRFVIKFKVII